MTITADDYQAVLERARAGNTAAIEQLVQAYEPDIRLIARARLGSALQPFLDSVDVVQSVHRCFMLGLRNGRFDVSTPEKLVAVAVGMVRNKVARQWRHLRCLDQSQATSNDRLRLSQMLEALTSREDDPARTAEMLDQMDRFGRELSDWEWQVIQMRFDGYSTAEVARALELDADMLRVQLGRLRKRLRANTRLMNWL
ncbi:hypothetical protein LBMAG52_46110 [Planctomycetia bacterium]|nr:hypothetical protein LBMAG52_46110 [Planctomycetia bacterium]